MEIERSKQWPQFLAVVCAGILAIGTGLQIGWGGPSVLKLLSNDLGFEITKYEIAYIMMIAPLGYIIGSPLSSSLLDRIGRKYVLILISIPQIINWLLIATSTNVTAMLFARLISGVADGALFTSFPIYIGEVSEPKVRGVIGSLFSIEILVGILLINLYGSYLSIRTTAYVSLLIPFTFLITFTWMPKSPYYLLLKGKVNEARKSLQSLRRIKDVSGELNSIQSAIHRQTSESGRLIDIFIIRSNLKAFLLVLGLRTTQQMSGLTALGAYIQYIFKQAGGNLTPAQSAIICSAIQIPCTCLSSAVVDRFGRKPLIILSCVTSGILLSTMSIFLYLQKVNYDLDFISWLPVIVMVGYNIVLGIGIITIPSIMAGELLSVSVKSKTSGLINIYLGVVMSASLMSFHYLNDTFGMFAPFCLFASFCLGGAFFCYFLVPETKGKTLDEIQLILKDNYKSNNNRNIKLEKLDNMEKEESKEMMLLEK